MQIARSSIETQKGPADWFTGDVYIDAVAAPEATSTFAAALVHFTRPARAPPGTPTRSAPGSSRGARRHPTCTTGPSAELAFSRVAAVAPRKPPAGRLLAP